MSGTTSTPQQQKLSAEQRKIVAAVADPKGPQSLLVIAGPGSGKTSTLVAALIQAVEGGVPPEEIAAISYTNNSAAELKVRLLRKAKDLNLPKLTRVQVSTFHSWVARLGNQKIVPRTHPPLTLGSVSFALALQLQRTANNTTPFSKAAVQAAERALEGSETFEDMEARDFNLINSPDSANAKEFADLKTALESLKSKLRENQINTFGSLMAQGPELAREFPGNLKWLFIDEAQDLNRPQKEFVFALQVKTNCRVFAIADDDQGIYKFRGASSEFLQELERRETNAPPTAQRFDLTENFRSTQPIVDLCRAWIEPNWLYLKRLQKNLISKRPSGLSIVLLTATKPEDRGHHAKIILNGAKEQKLCATPGECALLGFSPSGNNFELEGSKLTAHACADTELDGKIFKIFLKACDEWPKDIQTNKPWHHTLWNAFIEQVIQARDIPQEGLSGLDDLYACVEVLRRLNPEISPKETASWLKQLCPPKGPGNWFKGERPDPDYAGDKINRLSIHSSKGMEFRAVWLNGNGFTLAVSKDDEEVGQPNLFGELFDWVKNGSQNKPDDIKTAQKNAAQLERRRLLYVGMSRATDLLIISAPNIKKEDRVFLEKLQEALYKAKQTATFIQSDKEANEFVNSIDPKKHRHSSWEPPKRYELKSFTSLQQAKTIEDLPGPENERAVNGDHFHRIMYLLALEPNLIDGRLKNTIKDPDLVNRVCTQKQSNVEALLAKFFNDTNNQPWKWLKNQNNDIIRAEMAFEALDTTKDDRLIKGFLDVATFDANGNLIRIVDWKTGLSTSSDAKAGGKHEQQLQFYARLLKPAGQKEEPELINYYVEDSTKNLRPNVAARTNTPPTGLPLPSSPQSNVVALRAVPAPAKTLATSQQTPSIPASAPAPEPAAQSALTAASSPTCALIVAEAVAELRKRSLTRLGCRSIKINELALILSKKFNITISPVQIEKACAVKNINTYTDIKMASNGIPFLTHGGYGKWLNIICGEMESKKSNTSPSDANKPKKILSWNVGIGSNGFSFKTSLIQDIVFRNECDVVFLQEVPCNAKKGKDIFNYRSEENVEKIFAEYHAHAAKRGDYGFLTLIRKELFKCEEKPTKERLTIGEYPPFGLKVIYGDILYINVHLKSGDKCNQIRKCQMEQIITAIGDPKKSYFIGGDFNENEIQNLTQDLKPSFIATERPTYLQEVNNKNFQTRTYDYLMSDLEITCCASGALGDVLCAVLPFEDENNHLHLPLICQVE